MGLAILVVAIGVLLVCRINTRSTRLAVILALTCGAAACDKAETVTPAPTPVAPQAAACQPFTLEWAIGINYAGPTAHILAHRIDVVAVELFELPERLPFAGWAGYGIGGLGLHFNRAYEVRGKVGNCWSQPHRFSVGPANPDASGSKSPTVPAPPIPPCQHTKGHKKCWCH